MKTNFAVDAFTAEVIRSTVVAITDEMKTNLMRTAYNMIIYEAEDFTVGLFDAEGNTISIGLGLPMFIRGLSDAIKAKIAHWGKENIDPGDILPPPKPTDRRLRRSCRAPRLAGSHRSNRPSSRRPRLQPAL